MDDPPLKDEAQAAGEVAVAPDSTGGGGVGAPDGMISSVGGERAFLATTRTIKRCRVPSLHTTSYLNVFGQRHAASW